jgi:hypothetical protein
LNLEPKFFEDLYKSLDNKNFVLHWGAKEENNFSNFLEALYQVWLKSTYSNADKSIYTYDIEKRKLTGDYFRRSF